MSQVFVFVLITTLMLGFFSNQYVYAAGIPSVFTYQGRLADSSSNFLGGTGTTYYFKFSIWTTAVVDTGSRLWPTTAPNSVSAVVKQGTFNVNIGDTVNGYPDTLDYNFNNSNDVYLQVEVSSDNASFQTLSPRQKISATPFAKLSGAVSGTDSSSFGTTTTTSGSVVSIEATSTNTTALSLRAKLNQVADLFQVKSFSGSTLFSVDSLGGIFTSSTLHVTGTSTLATTTATILDVSGQTTLSQASTTGISATGASFGSTNTTGTATIANASTTNFSATGLFGTNAFISGLTGVNLTITGQTTLNNASSSALTLGIPSSSAGRIYFANASNNLSTQILSSSTQSSSIKIGRASCRERV